MAMSRVSQEQENQMALVETSLYQLPLAMAKFSSMIRSLYSTNQVTARDDGTRTFLGVRDNTRRNAAVYKDKVLPLTEEVIRHIGFFADSFIDFDFDDWAEGLEDIIGDIDKAIGFCEILRQMHVTIVQDLKKNEDKAKVGIQQLGKMAQQYEDMAAGLKVKAKELETTADAKRFWGAITAVITVGISTAILESSAKGNMEQAQEKLAEAFARTENASIAQNAVAITNNVLIPAVQEFVSGMDACSSFLVNTKENLEKMRNSGEKGAKERYYKAMKKRAQVLSTNSMKFLMMTDMMRTDIAAIPAELNDKNYVDVWFEQQKEQFRKEHKSIWAKIANATIGKKGKITFEPIMILLSEISFEES